MSSIIWIVIGFISGSLPFSIWLGKVILGLDVRNFGDGNPGATNLIKAGSPIAGIFALILDVGKAALPVGYCYFNLNYRGLPMVFIAVAPILGHMFSPILRGKGGKALATALGVWIGLTTWQVSVPAVIGVLFGTLIFSKTGWAVMFAMGGILVVLLLWIPDPLLFWVLAAETILLAWTHQADLTQFPKLHPRLNRFFHRSEDHNHHG